MRHRCPQRANLRRAPTRGAIAEEIDVTRSTSVEFGHRSFAYPDSIRGGSQCIQDSDTNRFDMASRELGQRDEIVSLRGRNLVSVMSQEYESRIDHVAYTSTR